MIQVLIVDDHPFARSFLESSFSGEPNIQVVGSIANAGVADLWCESKRPDVVFMDICTEGNASGLEAARRIKERFPHIKVIMTTGFDEISYVPRAKAIGADGFIYKSEPADSYLKMLHAVMEGKGSFPERKYIPVADSEAPLTEREREIIRLICQNNANAEIAEKLSISEGTVRRHIENMLRKTGQHSKTALVAYVLAGGWINPTI